MVKLADEMVILDKVKFFMISRASTSRLQRRLAEDDTNDTKGGSKSKTGTCVDLKGWDLRADVL